MRCHQSKPTSCTRKSRKPASQHFAEMFLLVAIVTLPNRALAAEPDSFVQLKWLRSAPATTCPEQAELERLVRARLGRDPFAAQAPRIVEASIDYADPSWHVELHVRDTQGQEQGRRVFDVRAASCEPVVDAVGLAVALAIDPNASLKLDTSPQIAIDSASRSDADARDAGQPRIADSKSGSPTPFPHARLLSPIELPCVPVSPWQVELTLAGVVAGGLLPGAAPGLSVAGYFGQHRSHALLGISYFAEAARDTRFSFGLTTVDVGYCHDIIQSRHMETGLCAAVHAGSQHAVVSEIQATHPGDHIIAAASLGPRFGWRAWAPLYVEIGASAWLPVVRPQFALAGQETIVFQSHSVSGVGYVGVGVTTN